MKRLLVGLLALIAITSSANAYYPGDITLTDPTKPYIVSSPGGFTIGDCIKANDVKGTAADAGTCGGLGAQNTIASASTTDIGSSGVTNNVKITGTTTITSLGSTAVTSSPLWFVSFSGSLTLTQNATSLKLPGAKNIVTQAGDSGIFLYLGSGNWQCLIYQPALATPGGVGFGAQASIASAGTTDLGTLSGNNALVTGTTTITSLGSSATTASPVWLIEFSGALTLTHNATSLILPGAANITTAAHDFAIANYLGSGNWRIWIYARATSGGATGATLHSQTFTTSGTFTFPAGTTSTTPFAIVTVGAGGGGGSNSGGNGGGGGGGGSGAASDYVLSGFTAGQNATITIGSGGPGSTSSSANGVSGGATTFVYAGHTVTSGAGGVGGTSGAGGSVPNAGGAGGTTSTDFTGLTLIDTIANGAGGNGGNGTYAGQSVGIGGAGGSNPLGQGGPTNLGVAGGNNTAGAAGQGYGSGGAGGESAGAQSTGGNAPSGAVIVQWVL